MRLTTHMAQSLLISNEGLVGFRRPDTAFLMGPEGTPAEELGAWFEGAYGGSTLSNFWVVPAASAAQVAEDLAQALVQAVQTSWDSQNPNLYYPAWDADDGTAMLVAHWKLGDYDLVSAMAVGHEMLMTELEGYAFAPAPPTTQVGFEGNDNDPAYLIKEQGLHSSTLPDTVLEATVRAAAHPPSV